MSTWQLALVAVAALVGSLALVGRQHGRALPTGTSGLSDDGRLAALANLGVRWTEQPDAMDDLAARMAGQLRAPSVLISVFDADHQIVLGQFGGGWGDASVTHGPLDPAETLCSMVVAGDAAVEIGDTHRRFEIRQSRAVANAGVRSYLGMPMRARSGEAVGVVGVYDRHARRWTADDHAAIARISQLAMRELERAASVPGETAAPAEQPDDGDSSAFVG